MNTELARGSTSAGFTLIEVLVAMVILSIGLLGLEALGIVAARSVGFAERQSGYALVAGAALEESLQPLRENPATAPLSRCTVLPTGDTLSVLVNTATVPNLPSVTVTVKPGSGARPRPASFSVVGHVYSPNALSSSGGSACP